MAYTLSKSNGATLILLNDGLVDTSVSSLNLIGKNVSNFGDAQNENFLFLLENFAKSTEPRSPLQGQIWFDSSSNVFRPAVFDGSNWRSLAVLQYSNTTTDTVVNAGGANFAASQPGDLWFNSATKQLFVVSGPSTETTLIGPELVYGFDTTKLTSIKVKDNTNTDRAIVEIVLDGEIIGILSKDTFTPSVSAPISGFSKVYRGLTFKNYSSSTRYATSGTDVVLHGLHEQLDTSYPRRNVNENIQSSWTFNDSVKLYFGTNNEAYIDWNDLAHKLDIVSNGTVKVGNVNHELTFGASEITPATNGTISLGNAFSKFNNLYINAVNATTVNVTTTNAITVNATTTNAITVNATTINSTVVNSSALYDNGARVLTTATAGASAVISIQGTANQIVSTQTNGVVTLSLPTNINVTTVNATSLYDNGARVLTTATAVTSIQGTVNQIVSSQLNGVTTLSLPTNMNVSTINANSLYDNGARVLTTATISNYGVTSIQGTANQITVNQSGGSVTVSLPNTVSIRSLQGAGAGNTGTIIGSWTLAAGSTLQATFADLAEFYESDQLYESGTVVVFGGEKEITTSPISTNRCVAGVVSENPAYLMNKECPGIAVAVALQGRVPVKVIGQVIKGDLLVTSSVAGYAEVNNTPCVGSVIGKALSNKNNVEPGIVEVAVGRL